MINPLDLHALADGELEKAEAAQLREALKKDPASQAEFESILNFKDVLREKPLRYESEECWRSCVKRLNELDRTKRVESFVGRYSWAMCALVFALILGGRYAVKDVRGDSARMADLDRVFPVRGNGAAPADPDLQRAYKDILDRANGAVDGKGLSRVGSSTGTFQGIPAARFILRDSQGPLVLFVIHDLVNFEDVAEDPTRPGMYTGVIRAIGAPIVSNCAIWHNRDFTMVLAGNRSPQDLESVAAQVGH